MTYITILRNLRAKRIPTVLLISLLLTGFFSEAAQSQCTVTGVSGSGFLFADQCAPVATAIYYEFTFGTTAPPEPSYVVVYDWDDGTTETVNAAVQTKVVFGNTVYFVRAELMHTFPVDGDCEYNVNMILLDNGSQCSDSRQVQIVGNWHEDDQAAGNGFITLSPDREDVCQGSPLIDFEFTDASNFACNVQDYELAQKPNHMPRHEQFVYGTNPVGGRGIPNLYIKVGTAGTVVYLTDNDGNPVPNSWDVDPVTGNTVAPYSTVTGYFEGPVTQIPVDALTGVYTLNNTYPISFDGVGTVYQDQFEVTLRNWNVCNPWNGSQTTPNAADANTDQSIIYIIDAPAAPTVPDRVVCEGGTRDLTVTSPPVGEIRWYDDNLRTTLLHTGATYTQPEIAPATYEYWVSDGALLGNLCESPLTQVTLIINPVPAKPTISVPVGSNPICYDGVSTVELTASGDGNTDSWKWYDDGVELAETGSVLEVGPAVLENDYTAVAVGIATTFCESDPSDPQTVAIDPQPEASAGGSATICQTGSALVSGASAANGTILWTHNGNGSLTNATTLTPTYIAVAADGGTAVTLTLTVTSTNACAPQAAQATFTVNVDASPAASAGGSESICVNGNATVSGATAANGTILWTHDGAGVLTNATTLTPTYTAALVDAGNAVTLTMTVTSTNVCNPATASAIYTVNVGTEPTAEAGGAISRCDFNPTDPIEMTGASATGAYSTALWSGGGVSGTWTQDTDPSLAIFTPTVNSGSFTATLTVTGSDGCAGTDPNDTRTIEWSYAADADAGPDQAICAADDATLAGSITGGIATGVWSGGLGTYNPANTDLNAVYTPHSDEVAAGTFTLTLTSSDPPGICGQVSDNVVIKIGAVLTNATLSGSGDVCEGPSSTLNATIIGGTPPYQLNIDGYLPNPLTDYTSGTDIPLGALTPGSYTYTLNTVTDACLSSISPADDHTINVNRIPDISTTTPATQTICNDGTASITLNTDVGGTIFDYAVSIVPATGFSWTVGKAPTDGSITDIAPFGSETYSQQLQHDYNEAVTITYTIAPTGPGGTACEGTAITREVVVEPTAVVTSAATANICNSTALGYNITSSTAGATFSWYRDAVTGISNTAVSGQTADPINEALINTTAEPIDVDYMITPIVNGCNGTPFTLTVTVHPTAVVTSAATADVCNSTALNYDITSSTSGATFTWYRDAVTGISNGAVSGQTADPITETPVNTTAAPVDVEYVITPIVNGCSGTPFTYTVTVNPTPTLSGTLTPADVCSNNPFNYTPTSATTGTTFSWERAAVAGLSPAGPAMGNDDPNETLRNITSGTIAVTYEYTLIANGCSNTQNIVVNIQPEPVITTLQNPEICSSMQLDYEVLMNNFDNPTDGVTFTWLAPSLDAAPGFSGGSARNTGSADNIGDTFINTGNTTLQATYTITPTLDGCSGNAVNVVIDVRPEPAGSDASAFTCSKVSSNYNLQANVNGNNGLLSDFTWVAAENLSVTGESTTPQTGEIITDIITNLTSADQDVVYTVTPTADNGCEGESFTITITVGPKPILTFPLAETVCSHLAANRPLSITNGVPGTTYEWAAPTLSTTTDFSGGTAGPAGSSGPITDIFQNTTGVAQTATYSVIPTSDAGCAGDPNDVVITVNPYPATSEISGDSEMCVGETNKIYGVVNTSGSSYDWTMPANLTASYDNGTYFVIVTGSSSGYGNITVQESNSYGCPGPVKTFTVLVSDYTSGSIVAGPASVCNGATGVLYSVPDNAGSTYSWTTPPGAAITTDPSAHEISVNFGLVGTGSFSVVETNISGCITIHDPLSVTVNPVPNIYNLTAPEYYCFGTTGVTVTLSSSQVGVDYQLYKDAVAEGAVVNGTGGALTWTDMTAGTYTVEAEYIATGCSGSMNGSPVVTESVEITGTATITSDFNGEDISCAGENDGQITIPDGTGFPPLQYSINGGANYQSGNIFNNLSAGAYTVRIRDSRLCAGELAPVTLNDPDALDAGAIASDQAVCFGGDPAELTESIAPTGATGTYTYQWQFAPDVLGPFTNISAATAATYTPPTNATATRYYRREVRSGICNPELTNIIEVFVRPLPVAEISGTTSICLGSSADLSVNVTTGSGPYNLTLSDGTNVPAYDSGDPVTVSPLVTTTYTIASIMDANGCSVTSPSVNFSGEATVTLDQQTEVVGAPQSMTICEDDDAWFVIGTGMTTLPTVTWEVSTDNGVSWDEAVGGIFDTNAAGDTLYAEETEAVYDGAQFRAIVSSSCGPNDTSVVAVLTYYLAPEILVQPKDSTVCEMRNVSFSVDAGATYAAAVQWYEDDGGGGGMVALSDGGNYIGTTTNRLQVFGVDSAMTGYRYEARVSNLCGGSLLSDPATLYVNSAPAIRAQPVEATICEGSDTSFSVMATGAGLVYEWYVDEGSGPALVENGAVYGGQGTSTLLVSGADRSYHLNRYYVRISGGCAPWVQSGIAFLYVENPPEVSVAPVSDTICEFGTASFRMSTTGAGLSYRWYESEDGVVYDALSDGGNYIGTGMANLSIFSVDRSYDENFYRVVVSGSCGSAEPAAVQLTVNVPPVISKQPADITVCDANAAAFIVDATGSPLTYQWRVNRNDGMSYVDISDLDDAYEGALTDSLTKVSALFAENGYSYRVAVTGICGVLLSNPALMSVNDQPAIVAQPTDEEVCEGTPAQFSGLATGPDLVYRWMVSRDDGGSWNPVSDGAVYEGATTGQLLVRSTAVAMDGYLYRLDVSSSCTPASSDEALLTVWENPVPVITGDLASFPILCGGETMLLDGGAAGGSGVYTTHKWGGDVMHLNGVNGQTARFRTRVKGDYNINYTVTDDHLCQGKASVVVQNFRPRAQFISDAAPACGNLTVNFSNRSSADAVAFAWDFDNGAFSSDVNPSAGFDNFDPTGLVAYYEVMLVAEDAEGCRDTAQSVVTIYPKVNPAITADPVRGCQPLEVYFQTQPGAAAYFWDYGDGTGENGSFTTNHMFSNLGTSQRTFKTVLQTTSAYGCVAKDTVEIVVDPIPRPKFTASPDMMTFPETENAVVTFMNTTATGPWTFVYDFGDGSSPFTTTSYENVVHEYSGSGIYTVKLYSNTNECLDSMMQVVTINPRRPEALFTAITEGCHPLEVTFTNNSLWADSYLWQFGDGSISREKDPVHVFYQPGEYTVRLVASGAGGNSDPASLVITVHPTPQVFFNYAPDSVFVNDKPVRFFNLSTYAEEYLWDFGDVSEYDDEVDPDNNSTEADPTHVYMYEGWKDVLLIGSNEFCIDSLFIPMAVKVIPAGDLRFPNIFRPGDSPMSGVNPNELSDEQRNMIFFPGVNRQVQEYHLYIYNRWGNLIFRSDDINIGWDGFVNNRKAAQGVYIWKVTGIYSNGSPFSDAGDVTLVWQ